MKKMKKTNIIIVALLSLWSCSQENKKAEKQCNCPIAESIDRKTEKGQNNTDQTWGVGAGGDVEAAIKKAVDAKISISGSYSNSNSKIEEVYREIIGSNPKITQKANLYRSIACAYYEVACQDKTLNEKDKNNRLNEVVAGYERNINKIITEEVSGRIEPKPNLTTKPSLKVSIPQETPLPMDNASETSNIKPTNREPQRVEEPKRESSQQQDEVGGIKISIVKCEIIGQRLNCHLIYENVSNEMNKYVPVIGAKNKVIDESGNLYKSSAISVGNVEQQGSGNRHCEIIKGTKVPGKIEFLIGDANISKLASLEISTTGRNHKFYNVKIN